MYRYRSIDIVEFLGDVDVRELDDATEIESHLLSIPDVKSLMTRRFQKNFYISSHVFHRIMERQPIVKLRK